MPTLVHLAPEPLRRRIERSGLRGRGWSMPVGGERVWLEEAVFAMPVSADFWTTHQWLRELRRRSRNRLVGVYFRLPSETVVYVGRFGQEHRAVPLRVAVAAVRESPAGAEIVIPGCVGVSAIRDVRALRQDVGWVETPEARSHYDCMCRMCLRPGTPNLVRRVRASYLHAMRRIATAESDAEVLKALGAVQNAIARDRDQLPKQPLMRLMRHPNPKVRARVEDLLGDFKGSPGARTRQA